MIGFQHQTLLPPRFSNDHQFCNHVVNFPLLHSYVMKIGVVNFSDFKFTRNYLLNTF